MIKSNLNIKLFLLINFLIICLIFALKSHSDDSIEQKNMVVIGAFDAAVKIKIYSSLTCPHCSSFHNSVVPEIKKA